MLSCLPEKSGFHQGQELRYSNRLILADLLQSYRTGKMAETISLKHRCEYYVLKALAGIIRRLPREQALKLGGRLGILGGMVLSKRYRLAEDNLRQAFPEWSQGKLSAICWANFQHVGICGAEMLRMDMYPNCGDVIEPHYEFAGFENFDQALALKKGVILLTGHIGFWEAGNYIFGALGYSAAAVTKPLKNPLTDVYITNIRENFGSETINSRKGARRILKALQQGNIVGILLDQHITPPGSVATSFFGRQAYTTTAITNLAVKYQIPIVPAFCQRLPGERYKITAEPMLFLEGEGEQAVVENTQLLTDIIERAVRKNPSQWFWMHKRWRVPADKTSK